MKFDPLKHVYASTEVSMHVFYFNRRSVYAYPPFARKANLLYNAIKILTFKTLKEKFNGTIAVLRQQYGCQLDVMSK